MSSLPIVFDDQHLNMDEDKTRLLIPSVDGMNKAEFKFWKVFNQKFSFVVIKMSVTYSSLAPCTSF